MDPLDRKFAEYTLPPSKMPGRVTESASQLVQHASSAVDAVSEAPDRVARDPAGSAVATAGAGDLIRRLAANISVGFVGRVFDTLAFLALIFMIYRTFMYVKRRRRGLVGPAMAPILIKFWTTYGVVECVAHMLSIYLTPMKGAWLVSVLRAIGLVVMMWGRRLGNVVKLYDRKLVSLFEAQEPEIEAVFARARERGDLINDAFKELATYLLKRIAVGGLSGAVSDLSEAVSAQTVDGDEGVAGQRQRAAGVPGRGGSPLPAETDVFSSGRQFFAGADDRADAVANASSDGMGRVIQVAAPEAPKAAYEDLRALRRKLSSRVRQNGKGKEAPP